jgi:hypothetical protein
VLSNAKQRRKKTKIMQRLKEKHYGLQSHYRHHHHHSEHGQGLGLKTCSFEAQGVPGPSILLSVFPYPPSPRLVLESQPR